MTNTIKIIFHSFLLLTTFFTSCNGQNQKQQQVNETSQQTNETQAKFDTPSPTLNADRIFCSIKDKAGNLWFGTYQSGLFKYDGNNFTHIVINDEPKENIIRSLFQDKDNNIWVGTDDKIWKFDGNTVINIPFPKENNYSFVNKGSNNLSPLAWVLSFMQDRSGKIWIGTGSGVYVYNGSLLTPFLENKNIINKDSINLRAVQTILEDKKGNIWFGTGGDGIGEDGICLFDGKTLTSIKPKGYGRCMASMEDENGDLYFSSGYSIFRYDGKSFVNIAEKEIHKIWSNFLFKDTKGILWLGAENRNADGGLYKYDKKTFSKFKTLDTDMISVVEDNKGNIWFGSNGQGLFRYDGKEFKSYSELKSIR